jgi:hypothetical protein
MKNDDFEIPDYEELDNNNNNNKNNNIDMNNSYRLPKRKAETVKQRYEEHVQAALDYRADLAESNQVATHEKKQQQQQQQQKEPKKKEINVNYEELYRAAIVSDNDNSDAGNNNNNNNNNTTEELDRVAIAYNATRSKQIEQEIARDNGNEFDNQKDVYDNDEEPEQLDPSLRWVTLEATEEDNGTNGVERRKRKKRNLKKKGRKKRNGKGVRRRIPNNIKVTTYQYNNAEIESDVQQILDTLKSTEPVRRTAVDLKEGQPIRYSLPSKEAKAQAIEALRLKHEEEEFIRERERKKHEALERQKQAEIEERKRFKAFIEIQEEKNALKSSEMLRAKEMIVLRRLERLEQARKKKRLVRRKLEKEKREAVRIRRIEQTKQAAKRIKEELDQRWENAVALKESGKLQAGLENIPSAWDRERNSYNLKGRMDSFMHRGGGGFTQKWSPGKDGSNKKHFPAGRRKGSKVSFRENVRGEPSETRWARAKREAEARKRKEDEDLLKEELDRQKRLMEQLRRKNVEKSRLKSRLSTNTNAGSNSEGRSNNSSKINTNSNNAGNGVNDKAIADEKAAKQKEIKLSQERQNKIKLARRRRKVLEAKLNRETRERIELQRKLEQKELIERARLEMMAKKKEAKEKKRQQQQQQQQNIVASKTDTNNKKKKSHLNSVIRKASTIPKNKVVVHQAAKPKLTPVKKVSVQNEANNDSKKSVIPPPDKGAKRWDRVQREAAERRRVVEELKKSEDQRKELKQKLLSEANKRKTLEAEIEARELREKRILEEQRENNRILIKKKEEKLRKLKLYEAEQMRIHLEEEKKWGRRMPLKKNKKGNKNRSVIASRNSRHAGSKVGMSPSRRRNGKSSGLRFIKNSSDKKSTGNKKIYTKSSGKRLEHFIDKEINERLKNERDLWEKEKRILLKKINEITNNQDSTGELDESSAEYKLMNEKSKQLEIIETELQKVTTALNASQINESRRALSPETSIDSEYEALGGWKEMQDLLAAYIPEQQQQQQQQQQLQQQKKQKVGKTGKSISRKKAQKDPPAKPKQLKSKSGMNIVTKTPSPVKTLPLMVNSVVADDGAIGQSKTSIIQSTYAPTPEMFGGMSPVRKRRVGNEHVDDMRDAMDIVQVGDIEFVDDSENPRDADNNNDYHTVDVATPTGVVADNKRDINPPIPSSSVPHGWKVVDGEYVKEDDGTVVPSVASWATTPMNKQVNTASGAINTPSSLFKTDIIDTVISEHQSKNRLQLATLDMAPTEESNLASINKGQQKASGVSIDGTSSPIDEMLV